MMERRAGWLSVLALVLLAPALVHGDPPCGGDGTSRRDCPRSEYSPLHYWAPSLYPVRAPLFSVESGSIPARPRLGGSGAGRCHQVQVPHQSADAQLTLRRPSELLRPNDRAANSLIPLAGRASDGWVVSQIVAFRSAKGRPFAERKATIGQSGTPATYELRRWAPPANIPLCYGMTRGVKNDRPREIRRRYALGRLFGELRCCSIDVAIGLLSASRLGHFRLRVPFFQPIRRRADPAATGRGRGRAACASHKG